MNKPAIRLFASVSASNWEILLSCPFIWAIIFCFKFQINMPRLEKCVNTKNNAGLNSIKEWESSCKGVTNLYQNRDKILRTAGIISIEYFCLQPQYMKCKNTKVLVLLVCTSPVTEKTVPYSFHSIYGVFCWLYFFCMYCYYILAFLYKILIKLFKKEMHIFQLYSAHICLTNL